MTRMAPKVRVSIGQIEVAWLDVSANLGTMDRVVAAASAKAVGPGRLPGNRQPGLRENQQRASRNTRLQPYLLRGRIRCALCGRVYSGMTRKGWSVYVCRGRYKLAWGLEKCTSRPIRAEAIEEGTCAAVVEFLENPSTSRSEAQRLLDATAETMASLRRELADLERQQRHERDAEARAFRLATRGEVSEGVFTEEVQLIQTRLRSLESERQSMEARLADVERSSVDPEALEFLRNRLSNRLHSADAEERRFVLDCLQALVIAHGDGCWELEIEVPQEIPPAAELSIANSRPRELEGGETPAGRA